MCGRLGIQKERVGVVERLLSFTCKSKSQLFTHNLLPSHAFQPPHNWKYILSLSAIVTLNFATEHCHLCLYEEL